MPKRRSGSSVSINWSDVELKNFVNREGTFLFKVTKAEESNDGDAVVVKAEVIGGSPASQIGKSVQTFFNLQPQSLWKLAQFLEACGQEIPESEEDLDLEELVDVEFGGEVAEHKYDGKTYMRIQQFFPAEEMEDAKPAKKKRATDEDEAPAKEADEDEEGEDTKPEKRGRGRPKGAKDKTPRRAKEEETKPSRRGKRADDDEDEEAPARKPKKGKDLPKVSESEIDDMSEDDLESLVEKYGLDVDLSEKKTLRGKGALVLDALEEKELLED